MNFNRFLSSHDSVYPGVSAQGECLPRWGVCPVGCLARECVARGVSPGGVCPGACLPKGGAYCPEGCVARGVSLRVVCLWGVCPGGVYPGGGVCAGRMCILACTGADTPTPVYRILDTVCENIFQQLLLRTVKIYLYFIVPLHILKETEWNLTLWGNHWIMFAYVSVFFLHILCEKSAKYGIHLRTQMLRHIYLYLKINSYIT